jgi:hypothetical protein
MSELLFPDAAAAAAFGADWLADEDPGCCFEVKPAGPRFALLLFEPDGYLINREPPRACLGGPIRAPKPQPFPHLG